ncbi:hypothetical protein ACFLY6_02200 [Candidatus Dependentiae bacterium]
MRHWIFFVLIVCTSISLKNASVNPFDDAPFLRPRRPLSSSINKTTPYNKKRRLFKHEIIDFTKPPIDLSYYLCSDMTPGTWGMDQNKNIFIKWPCAKITMISVGGLCYKVIKHNGAERFFSEGLLPAILVIRLEKSLTEKIRKEREERRKLYYGLLEKGKEYSIEDFNLCGKIIELEKNSKIKPIDSYTLMEAINKAMLHVHDAFLLSQVVVE